MRVLCLAKTYEMVKQFFQQGRIEQRTEAYSFGYVEVLRDARTKLKDYSPSHQAEPACCAKS